MDAPGLIEMKSNLPVVDYERPHAKREAIDRCPTGVIILGKIGDPAVDGDAHQRTNTHGYGYGMRLG